MHYTVPFSGAMKKQLNQLFPEIEVFPWRGHSSADLAQILEVSGPLFLWDQHPQPGQKQAFAYHQPGRFSYLGLLPRRVLDLRPERSNARDPLLELEQTNSHQKNWARIAEIQHRFDFELPPFVGGTAGFLSYDSVRFLEKVVGSSGHASQPDAFLMELDSVLVIDRQEKRLMLIHWPRDAGHSNEAELNQMKAALNNLQEPKQVNLVQATHAQTESFRPRLDKASFIDMVNRAKEYICAGDVFQVVMANTLQSSCQPDPLVFYEKLIEKNPSPYHFLVRFAEHTLVGASPEVLLCGVRPSGSEYATIAMRPVAGTYPRSLAESPEQGVQEALRADPKEHAEHVMLVDHARNDIGKVSKIGSVRVDGLCTVETYADVHHLVTQVSGALRPEESMLTALRSCFPIATLTGTPKIRAMEIIAELEGPSRGIFGGAVLLIGHDSFLDSGVVIRSAVIGPQGTSVQAGAGIVYDSDPAREYEECLWKAKAVLEVALSACGEQ